jgi:hypothetical protein
MKKLLRIIRNNVEHYPEDTSYYEACVQMQEEDGLYTIYEDWCMSDVSISCVKEEGSPFCI